MSNSDAIDETAPQMPAPEPARPAPRDAVLWVLAAVFAGTNMTLSLAGQDVVAVIFGVGVLACLAMLLTRRLRRGRR